MLPYTLKDRLRESLIWGYAKYSPMYNPNLIKSPTFLFVHSGTSQEKNKTTSLEKNQLFGLNVGVFFLQ